MSQVRGHHPNTYTFSKALAEFLLVRTHRSLAKLHGAAKPGFELVVVRPSIISQAADAKKRNPRRPNFAGLNGILALAACGYYSDEKVANRNGRDFGWGIAHGGRYATPADFPRHDGTAYRELHVRRWVLGFVHRSRAIFCRAVPNLSVTIRNSFASL